MRRYARKITWPSVLEEGSAGPVKSCCGCLGRCSGALTAVILMEASKDRSSKVRFGSSLVDGGSGTAGCARKSEVITCRSKSSKQHCLP